MQEYLIDQNWSSYSDDEHQMWSKLFKRQEMILDGRVAPVFLEGVKQLEMASDGIPKFEDLSKILTEKTGWSIGGVASLVPDEAFFNMLANRIFPSTNFIRKPEQMDYLQEPDIFHDVFGHVPLLIHPVFANYMQEYGKAGLKALGKGQLHNLARLYWYTVEFGLMMTDEGLRTYGSGVVSSYSETIYSVEDKRPHRIRFDLERVMRTNYRIDDFQEVYFVIDSFEHLFQETLKDFGTIYEDLAKLPDYAPSDVTHEDVLIQI